MPMHPPTLVMHPPAQLNPLPLASVKRQATAFQQLNVSSLPECSSSHQPSAAAATASPCLTNSMVPSVPFQGMNQLAGCLNVNGGGSRSTTGEAPPKGMLALPAAPAAQNDEAMLFAASMDHLDSATIGIVNEADW